MLSDKADDAVKASFGRVYRWSVDGKSFVATEHDPVKCDLTGIMLRVTLDVVTKKGLREVGSATCLMEAFRLSRSVRIKYTAPDSEQEIAAMICDGTRNDTYRAPRGARRRSN